MLAFKFWGDKDGETKICCIYVKFWRILLPIAASLAVGAVGLAVPGTSLNWSGSDVLDTLFLVLPFVLTFTMLYQYYIYKLQATYDVVKEDLGRTRQQSEMFLFLFLYQVAYLSGVTACTSMAMMTETRINFGFAQRYCRTIYFIFLWSVPFCYPLMCWSLPLNFGGSG